jgi:hypoxanthine phosphoribosyltransferase
MFEPAAEVGQILIDEDRVAERVRDLGQEISRDYKGRQPLMVGVLRGAVVFLADLIRHLELNLRVDFMSVASYGSATDSSGEVRLVKDLESSILGADVILVEDIVDTGLTLDYLLRNLENHRPGSLRVCSLLSKPDRRRVEVPVDYLGFEVPDKFVVGYGLDFNQQFRNLPHIAVLNQDS